VRDFVTWWAEEDLARNAALAMTVQAFPGAQLAERHGSQLRFKIPPQGVPIGELFSRVEAARAPLNIRTYSLSQTSLEAVFNSFAAQQEEETGVARGMGAVTAAVRGAAGPPPPMRAHLSMAPWCGRRPTCLPARALAPSSYE
jgi:hypothetical protein